MKLYIFHSATILVYFSILIYFSVYNNLSEILTLQIAEAYATRRAYFVNKDQQGPIYVQWKQIHYENTFEDFNELIIQFGYVCM